MSKHVWETSRESRKAKRYWLYGVSLPPFLKPFSTGSLALRTICNSYYFVLISMTENTVNVDQDPFSGLETSSRARSISQGSSKTIIHRPKAATRLAILTPKDDGEQDSEVQSSPAESARTPDSLVFQFQKNSKGDSVGLSPHKRLPRKPVPRSASGWERNAQTASHTTEGTSALADAHDAKQNLIPTIWMSQRSTSMPLTARNVWDVAMESSLNRDSPGEPSEKSAPSGKKSVRNRIIGKFPKFLKPKKRA